MLNKTALLQLIGCSLMSSRSIWLQDFSPPYDPSGKIINGELANDGEFKYVVGLSRKLDRMHKCGGTIITKNWVLTAAHCCELGPARCFTVLSGSIYRDRARSKHVATKLIIHEDYQSEIWRNDICLIRVFPPFKFDDDVQQVTLPPQDWPVLPGDKVIAPGWGFTTPLARREIPNRMRKLDMVVLTKEECEEKLGREVLPGYICARGLRDEQGICQGDSGGPLMKNNVQVGISSFVLLPCGKHNADFFVRLPLYVNWIKDRLGDEANELKIYS